MFGFSLAMLIVTTFGVMSAISTLIIIGACIASGRSSRSNEMALELYLHHKRLGITDQDGPVASRHGHRTYQRAPSQSDHRSRSDVLSQSGADVAESSSHAEKDSSQTRDLEQSV